MHKRILWSPERVHLIVLHKCVCRAPMAVCMERAHVRRLATPTGQTQMEVLLGCRGQVALWQLTAVLSRSSGCILSRCPHSRNLQHLNNTEPT